MYQQSASKMYAQIDVESEILNATPYQLIQILFNGALSAPSPCLNINGTREYRW